MSLMEKMGRVEKMTRTEEFIEPSVIAYIADLAEMAEMART